MRPFFPSLTSFLGRFPSSAPFSRRRPRIGRHSPALILRLAYIPNTKRTITPITLPYIAYGCHAGCRTFTGKDARFSAVRQVYGSVASYTYAWIVLLPWPKRGTVNTSLTVSPAAMVWFDVGFPFLSNHWACWANRVVWPPLIAERFVTTRDAAKRFALFVTLTETVTESPSAGSVGLTFIEL